VPVKSISLLLFEVLYSHRVLEFSKQRDLVPMKLILDMSGEKRKRSHEIGPYDGQRTDDDCPVTRCGRFAQSPDVTARYGSDPRRRNTCFFRKIRETARNTRTARPRCVDVETVSTENISKYSLIALDHKPW
jgi:hypothetical protein